MRKATILLGLLASGCGDPDDGDAQETDVSVGMTSAMTGTSAESSAEGEDTLGDDTGCEPGSPGCPCAGGMCLDPLVCVDNECSWPPPTTTDSDPTDPSDATTGEPPSRCVTHDDCNDPEYPPNLVCTSAGECEPAIVSTYLVTVTSWHPTTCDGGAFDGDADLWWGLLLDGELLTTSPFQQGGCPGAWEHTFCVEGGGVGEGFATSFRLNLYDEDNTQSELHDTLWFDDDGDGMLDLIPAVYLVEGEYSGPTNYGGSVEIEFIHEGC